MATNIVKTSQHAAFDESYCGFDNTIAPHDCILGSSSPISPDIIDIDKALSKLDITFLLLPSLLL